MTVTLTVNGQVYQRWTGTRVTRGLLRACGGFEVETPGEIDPPILPFGSCVLADDGEQIITGYVDEVRIEIAARGTKTRITGRSKTADLVDCIPELSTNQFNGYTIDQIARAMAAPFGINVVVGPGVDVGNTFSDATYEWNEPAFRFLNRLARQRGVLLTDNPMGDLVIATAGTDRAPAGLTTGPGGNVFEARGTLSGRHRFSKYTIRSQTSLNVTGVAETDIEAQALDPAVPRYRPWSGIAESALSKPDAQKRADWERSHRFGDAVVAVLAVPEWRAAGQLWQINQLAKCTVPRLGLNDTLLIGGVDFRDDQQGRRTDLMVARPAAFSLQPLAPTDSSWAGVPNVAAGAAGTPTTGKAGPSSAAVGSSPAPLT